MQVVKRNGELTDFNELKIVHAIEKAFAEFGETCDKVDEMAAWVADAVDEEEVDVEEIQDAVEDALIIFGYADVAKAYIKYRYDHELRRQAIKEGKFKTKLFAEGVENQNANVDEYSFGGRLGEASSVLMEDYALNHCMSAMARENHQNMEIYVHDLSRYALGDHNCLTIPFDDLLANGFNTRQTDIRPAQSVSTAFQLIAVIFQLQSLQQFG